jgi:hypothetical protein
MSPAAIEMGAFTWSRIQRLYDANAVVHWRRCEAEGCSVLLRRSSRSGSLPSLDDGELEA